jgi:hypothetical protein
VESSLNIPHKFDFEESTMEEQDAKNLARGWINDSKTDLDEHAFENALWTATKAIEDLVPQLDGALTIPREHAELPPNFTEGTTAIDELLVMSGEYLFRITGWIDSDSDLEVAFKRLLMKDFGEPIIAESRFDVNGADVRRRGWQFLHKSKSRLFLKTERIVNANYDREDPEAFAQELSKRAGWEVSADATNAPILVI